MVSVELIDDDRIEDPYTQLLFSTKFSVNEDVAIRIGDEYQVDIPPLMPVSYYIQFTQYSTDVQTMSTEHKRLGCCCVSFEPESVTEKGECSGVNSESSENNTKLGEAWSDIEEAIFHLGVYIFGKCFDQVKRFIECKNMGDILYFYYGAFYKSNRYHKWKKKCKRRMYGSKIFTGLRQKELLSRLLPLSSEDCHHDMLEVSKTYGEGTISLEDYVSTLKTMTGIENLMEAVGLGKRKHDLTRLGRESLRSSQGFPLRAKIPSSKACSSLKPADIIMFLTGDFRLTKAKSNDLFWEAVWPRLLARGWHSEQPVDRTSLVFLVPEVKKFSRRKLIKGSHYFDSITDVLRKVGSEPELLELEVESNDDEKYLENVNLSDRQRYCCLQPIMLKQSAVDMSLGNGEVKVREIRCLQVETLHTSHSEEVDTDNSSEEPTAELYFDMNRGSPTNGSSSSTVSPKINMEGKTIMSNAMQLRKPKKSQKSHRMRRDDSTYLSPVIKLRRKLSACKYAETNHSSNSISVSSILRHEEGNDSLDNPDAFQEKLPSTKSWAKSNGSNRHSESYLGAEDSNGKPKRKILFDLNVVLPEDETDKQFMSKRIEKQEDQVKKRRLRSADEAPVNVSDKGPPASEEWYPSLTYRGRRVLASDTLDTPGVPIALLSAIQLPADMLRIKQMSHEELANAYAYHQSASIQFGSKLIEDSFRYSEERVSFELQLANLKIEQLALERFRETASNSMKACEEKRVKAEATFKKIEGELVLMQEAHAGEVQRLTEDLNRLKLSLADATVALTRAVAKEAEIQMFADAKVKNARERAEVLEQSLVELGAKGFSKADLKQLLDSEFEEGGRIAQEQDAAEIPRIRRGNFFAGWCAGVRAAGVGETSDLLKGPPSEMLPTMSCPIFELPVLATSASSPVPGISSAGGDTLPLI